MCIFIFHHIDISGSSLGAFLWVNFNKKRRGQLKAVKCDDHFSVFIVKSWADQLYHQSSSLAAHLDIVKK